MENVEKKLRKYSKEALALQEKFLKANPIKWGDCDPAEAYRRREQHNTLLRQAGAIFYGYKAQERYDLHLELLRRRRELEYGCYILNAFKKCGAKENELEKFYIEQEKKVLKKRLQEEFK